MKHPHFRRAQNLPSNPPHNYLCHHRAEQGNALPHRVRSHSRPRMGILVAVIACMSLAVTACMNTGTSTGDTTGSGASDMGAGAQREGERPTVEKVPKIAKSVPKKVRESGKLTVVMSTSSPPAHFKGKNGTMHGADVDIGRLLGEVFGLKTEVVGVPLDQILPGFQAGRYDVAVTQFSPTAERAKVLDFVNYALYATSLGVPSGNPDDLTPDQLCGHRVGVQKGSVQAGEVIPDLNKTCRSAGKSKLKMSRFPDSSAALLGLRSNRVDGVLLDSPVLGYAAKQSKGKIEVAGTFNKKPVAIGTPKDNGLVKPIQSALQYLDSKGLLEKSFNQWGMTESTIHKFAINKIQQG